MVAVRQNGMSLKHVCDNARLRNDKELILEAVNQDGTSLMFASDKLRNDEEVVLVAVSQNKASLQYASERLRNICW
jgi:hypothetical protein